jgi:hypothetical protein
MKLIFIFSNHTVLVHLLYFIIKNIDLIYFTWYDIKLEESSLKNLVSIYEIIGFLKFN